MDDDKKENGAMNIVMNNSPLKVSMGAALVCVALVGCTAGPETGFRMMSGGLENGPFELRIDDPKECPKQIEPFATFGAMCDLEHPGALCVKREQWLRWSTGKRNLQKIQFTNNPLHNCKPRLPARSYKCQVKKGAPLGVYEYSVTLAGCDDFDPKIIISK